MFKSMCHVSCVIDHWRLKYTEVQSQQMAFTQSSSLSNNPKIPTYYLIFAVSCVMYLLTYHVIWHFMSFDISCLLTFHVIWHFMSFEILCDSNHSHQSHQGINAQIRYRGPVSHRRCVLKKLVRADSHTAYLPSFSLCVYLSLSLSLSVDSVCHALSENI